MDSGAAIPARPDIGGASGSGSPIDISVERGADWRVPVAALAAAVAADLAVRSGGAGTAGALLVVVVAGGMLASGRVDNRQAVGLIAAAPVFGLWLAIRTSPWLVPLDVLASMALLAAGASLARGGSVLNLSPVPVAVRAAFAALHAFAAPGFLVAPVRRAWRGRDRLEGTHRRGLARGLLFAVPVLIVLGALLGSADPVFASWLRVPASPQEVVSHAFVLVLGAWGMGALLRVVSAREPRVPDVPGPRIGAVEAFVVVGGLVALFAVFAVAQVVTASGGASTVLRTRGLTYAQYARSGFFQLVAVAVVTLVVLLSLRAFTVVPSRRARVVFLVLGLAAVVLTLGIVGVAVRRMQLYERAFGLTMLRLYVEVAVVAIGAVFVALAVRLLGVGSSRPWLTPVAVGLALVSVLVLDVLNPEAVVARHDMERAARTGRVDVAYLSTLSGDAIPTLVAMAPDLPKRDRRALQAALCGRLLPEKFHGWAAWNLARTQAREALAGFCGRTG